MSEPIGRAFLAVVPPAPVLDAIAGAIAEVGEPPAGWRWTAHAHWHVTLQFLGRVADADALGAAVAPAVAGVGAFGVRLGGAGAFPSARRAGVAWVGVAEGADPFGALAARVSAALEPLGFARGEERFHPHLTVARTRGRERRDARALVDAFGAAPLGERFTVAGVVLFESRTRASGAEYTARATFPLSGGAATGDA
ncbi:MAG: RNA 2',3'-cyclic phosphodiesterase [Actinobacteria bacterium]|nr:RNA 2',3'-cyclic phosphodiesterase [Actinomycetota bacterium]